MFDYIVGQYDSSIQITEILHNHKGVAAKIVINHINQIVEKYRETSLQKQTMFVAYLMAGCSV